MPKLKELRTARLWVNQGVLAVSLYEGDVEVSYCPVEGYDDSFDAMEKWVRTGER